MKKTLKQLGVFFGTLAMSLTIGNAAYAADFSFRGNFNQDDDVQLFDFTVGAASNVTLRTYSYAGGTQADGTVVAAGGFDPILALFDAAGNLVDQNDDDFTSVVAIDPVTSVGYDTLLEVALAAGSYTVSVMQYDNFATGPSLADGFNLDGQGNFTLDDCPAGSTAFCDITGDARTNQWAFDVLNVGSAVAIPPTGPEAVPEPALLSGLAMLGLAGLKGKKRKTA